MLLAIARLCPGSRSPWLATPLWHRKRSLSAAVSCRLSWTRPCAHISLDYSPFRYLASSRPCAIELRPYLRSESLMIKPRSLRASQGTRLAHTWRLHGACHVPNSDPRQLGFGHHSGPHGVALTSYCPTYTVSFSFTLKRRRYDFDPDLP